MDKKGRLKYHFSYIISLWISGFGKWQDKNINSKINKIWFWL